MRKCKFCKLEITKKNLSRHINTIHLGMKRFDCKTCGKAFTNKKNMEAHENKCEEDDEDDNNDAKC